MAITENVYTGNGSTLLYAISFPYLNQSDVKVTVNGTLVTNYSFANTTTIQFGSAPASGAIIRIYRQTDDSQIENNFFAGASIKANDLNEDFNQALYLIQEKLGKYGDVMNGSLDMGGNKITGLADPEQCTDAIGKCWAEDNFLGVPDDTAVQVPYLWVSYAAQNTIDSATLNEESKITQDLEGNSYQAAAYKLYGSGNPQSLMVTKRNAVGQVQWSKIIDKANAVWQGGWEIAFNPVNSCLYLAQKTAAATPQRIICLNTEGTIVWAKAYTTPAHPTLEPGSGLVVVIGDHLAINSVTGHVYVGVQRGDFYKKGGGLLTLLTDGTVASFNWFPLSQTGTAQGFSRVESITNDSTGNAYVMGQWWSYDDFFGGGRRQSSFLFQMNAAGTTSQSFRVYGNQHVTQANNGYVGIPCLFGYAQGSNLARKADGSFVIAGADQFFNIGSNYTPISTFSKSVTWQRNLQLKGADISLSSYGGAISSTITSPTPCASFTTVNTSNQIASGRQLGFNNINSNPQVTDSSSLTNYDLNVSTHNTAVVGFSLDTTATYSVTGLTYYPNNTYQSSILTSAPANNTPITLTSATNPPVSDSASVTLYVPVTNNGLLISGNVSTVVTLTYTNESTPSNVWLYGYTNTTYTTSIPLVPTSASYPGSPGNVAWDANYIYFCTATNSWKRVAFTSW
jgi:hypothetical protein